MKSLDDVVLDPEFVGGTISHAQLEECNHKGQHLIEDCGLDASAFMEEEPKTLTEALKDHPRAQELLDEIEDCGLDLPSITEVESKIREGETGPQTKSTNPKDILAREEQRVLLHLIPSPGLVHTALAMMDGARKYGPYNWREEGVGAGTYISAAQRHLRDWLDGEECAPDSGTHHLGHAAACLMILMDAQVVGNLVDDRPAPAPTAEMMEEVKREGKVASQREEGREEYGPGGCAV